MWEVLTVLINGVTAIMLSGIIGMHSDLNSIEIGIIAFSICWFLGKYK